MTSLLENSEAQKNECRVLPKETTSQKHLFLNLTSVGTDIELMTCFHQYFLVEKENIGPKRLLFSVLSIGKNQNKY